LVISFHKVTGWEPKWPSRKREHHKKIVNQWKSKISIPMQGINRELFWDISFPIL
jgi:hypothetical protein